jgi:hypothetical protein
MAKKTVLNPAGKDPHERPAFRRLAREIGEALMPPPVEDDDDPDDRSQHSYLEDDDFQ